MISEKKIKGLVAEALSEDQFIVELRVSPDNKVYIEVDDKSRPISIQDCIKVSRQVEHELDREIEDFSLEVASPGLDRPFRVKEQYEKNIGRPVKVKRVDGTVTKGELKEVHDNRILLEWKEKQRIEGRKAKKWVTLSAEIPIEEIKETHIEIVF